MMLAPKVQKIGHLIQLLEKPSESPPWCADASVSVQQIGYDAPMFPDDTGKDLAAVLSYMAGRTLSKEQLRMALELPRSTYYDQLDKGTLISADNLQRAAANLGINRAELLARYRFIEPEEVVSLAAEIREHGGAPHESVSTDLKTDARPRTKVSDMSRRSDAPPL